MSGQESLICACSDRKTGIHFCGTRAPSSFETAALRPPQDDGSVPRMLRSAKRCAADPGSIVHSASAWVPALRCIVQNAAPRPGHEMHCFTLSQDEAVAVRDRSSHCVTNAACAGG